MEFKGTKGKWKIGVVPDYNDILKSAMLEVYSNSFWICKVQNNGVIGKKEGKANALLISKAPEMLEMLNNIVNGYELAEGEMWIPDYIGNYITEAKQLIKEATEL